MIQRSLFLSACLVASSSALATSPSGPGTCPSDGLTYELLNGRDSRVIWMPRAFCRGTALFEIRPGNELWHDAALTDGGFAGIAKVIETGCPSGSHADTEFLGSKWNVSFDLAERSHTHGGGKRVTVPKLGSGPRPDSASWKLMVVENGRITRRDKSSARYYRFSNRPSNLEYGNQIGLGADPIRGADVYGGAFWFNYWSVEDLGGEEDHDGPYKLLWDAHGDFNYGLLDCEDNDCPVDADHPLGPASGYNVYAVEDLVLSNSDIAGRTAAGGDVEVYNYGLNSSGRTGTALSVTGHFKAVNSQLYGTGGGEAGSCSLFSLGTPNSTMDCTGASFDAGAASNTDALDDLMDWIASEAAGAPSSSLNPWWPQLIIDGGTGSGVSYVNVDTCAVESEIKAKWSWATNIQGWDVKAGSGATLVVNMTGDCGDFFFKNGYMSVSGGVDRTDIVWVMQDMTSLRTANMVLQGSLLAPYTDVELSNGGVDGSVVVRSATGAGEIRGFEFEGDICPTD